MSTQEIISDPISDGVVVTGVCFQDKTGLYLRIGNEIDLSRE